MLTREVQESISRGQMTADPERMARSGVAELCALAAKGLAPMLDPDKRLFCHKLNRTQAGLMREGLSPRYTAMCLLGFHRMETAGQIPSPVDLKVVFDALVADLTWVDNVGDLGLLLWLCAVSRPERLKQIYSDLEVRRAFGRYPGAQRGATMEISWLLAGLAHAALAGAADLPDLAAISQKVFLMVTGNQGRHGSFGHLATSGSATGSLRGRIGSFADQVYPIYALARFGQAFRNRAALEGAKRCADAICRAQGPLGQWWWHYDSVTGNVFQRYPVYSVHQHAMGPMALFALGDAAGLDFSDSIFKGLAWIYGNNELSIDMREPSAQLVWRSVYRHNPVQTYVTDFFDFLTGTTSPVTPGTLKIKFECRPYELGWLLYAFAGRARA